MKCKQECNVRYIEHKTRDTKILFKNLLLQIVLIYQQAIVGSRPKTKQLISRHLAIPTYSHSCVLFALGQLFTMANIDRFRTILFRTVV